MINKIPASRLKDITVYAKDDLYDFARLVVRIHKAKDIAEAREGAISRSYITVFGLLRAFEGFIRPIKSIQGHLEEMMTSAGISMGATLIPDDEIAGKNEVLESALARTSSGPVHIYLAGVTGVGKTTIGEILAARLTYKFFDLDQEIEREYDNTLWRIKLQFRNAYSFRVKTAKTLKKIIEACDAEDFVLALPDSGLEGPYLRAISRDERLVVALLDTPEAVLARAEFFDEDGKKGNTAMDESQRRDTLNDIKTDIAHFESICQRADLRVQLDGAGIQESIVRVEEALERAARLLGNLPTRLPRNPATRGRLARK